LREVRSAQQAGRIGRYEESIDRKAKTEIRNGIQTTDRERN